MQQDKWKGDINEYKLADAVLRLLQPPQWECGCGKTSVRFSSGQWVVRGDGYHNAGWIKCCQCNWALRLYANVYFPESGKGKGH